MIIKKTGVFAWVAVQERQNEMVSGEEFNDINVALVIINFKMIAKAAEYSGHSWMHMFGNDKPHPNLLRHTIKANGGYEHKLRKQNHRLTHVRPNQHSLLPTWLSGAGAMERIVSGNTMGIQGRHQETPCRWLEHNKCRNWRKARRSTGFWALWHTGTILSVPSG